MQGQIKLREFTVKLSPRHSDEKTINHCFDFGTMNADYLITEMKIGFDNPINHPVTITELKIVVGGDGIFKVKNPTDVSNIEFVVSKYICTEFIVITDRPTKVWFTVNIIC